jgi:tetratricopeptide (TPR) repeat protein
MGDILAELARKSDAKEAGRYWAEAMTAYHAASQVLTRERSPERWATLQYTRGKALIEQANRAGAEDPKACASEALVAYEGAQLVYTRAAAPNQYAGTQYGIAQAHLVRGDRIAAADATDVALELVPESIQSLRIAERLFQDHLFAFERAFELNERRVQLEGDALVRLDFAEKHLTTARFAGCVAHLAPIDVEGRVVPVRESIRFACEFAMGNKEAAAMSSNALLELAAGLQKPGWVFAGTLHFIASHDAFAASRASWTQLFEKLEAGDGNGLAAAVREIRKTLVP